ncbi:TetR/AcrR family transcriptional regulator [Sporichthya polymorpha]|uniref:TetR/AcrR family transcriptional regulator n=1 Tax=Sporichthya polymorpha TaxID=35751 RepID=UPI00038133B7|nr:TetR/AcrR family transcriptional regulator [Sporichthya polymorpha]
MVQTTRSPSARVQRRQQRTRAELTRAAARIIATKGVDGLRLREVTDEADVGFGSFYNYFSSKEELVEAVVSDLAGAAAAALGAQLAGYADPAEAVCVAHRWLVRAAVEDPVGARLLVQLDHADVRLQERLLPLGVALMETGMTSGRFRPTDSPATTVSYLVGATLALMRAVLEGRVGPEAESQTGVVMLQALGLDAADAHEIAYRDLPSAALVDLSERTLSN